MLAEISISEASQRGKASLAGSIFGIRRRHTMVFAETEVPVRYGRSAQGSHGRSSCTGRETGLQL